MCIRDSYWICESGQSEQLDDLVINCGNLLLAPGDMVTVEGNVVNIASDDGEMGLFSDDDFTDPANVVDYVEWGSTGHEKSDEAVAAGIWSTGDFVAAFAMDESLEYDGDGDAPTDWNTALANPCGISNAPPVGPAIIVISEINPEGNFIELRNIGGTMLDVSALWLCDNVDHDLITSLAVICGDVNLLPGETVTLEGNNIGLDGGGGEMALFVDSSFGDPNSLIDYVEWGSSNNERSDLAVTAGMWTTGDFVPAFPDDESIEFDGNGDTSADWSVATPNPCDEIPMIGSPPIGSLASMDINGNPVQDMLRVNVQTSVSFNEITLDIRDMTGVLVKSESILSPPTNVDFEIDVADIPQGLYYITIRELFGTVTTKMVKQ